MREHNILHRDMKPGNLLLGHNLEIKVGDFGLAVKLSFLGERRSSFCGTPCYMAPEQLESLKGHSYECDVWALGVIIYFMFTGETPFVQNAQTTKQITKNI